MYKKVIKQIKAHKVLFVGLMALQVLFFVSFMLVAIFYQINGINSARELLEPIQGLNFDKIKAGESVPFDLGKTTQIYKTMWKSLRMSIYVPLILFLLLNGLVWVGTHHMIDEKRHKLKVHLKRWLKFIVSGAIFMIPYFLLSDLYISRVFSVNVPLTNFMSNVKFIGLLFIPLYYLMMSSFAFLDRSTWKRFYQSIVNVAVKKFYKVIPFALLLHMIIGVFGYILFWTLDKELPNFTHVGIASVFFFAILLITRLFWINYLQRQ